MANPQVIGGEDIFGFSSGKLHKMVYGHGERGLTTFDPPESMLARLGAVSVSRERRFQPLGGEQ